MYFWIFRPRTYRLVGPLLLGLLASGCASNANRVADPRDPLEPFNRAVFHFNTDFDNAFMVPLAKGYQAITPEPVDRGITNFFNNIDDFTSFVNNILQFKMSRAGSDLGRIFMNSTVGILGFFDVATNAGLPSYKEDFGQTLGYWGLEPGAYFMLPIVGPSTIRDTIGFAGDVVTDPFFSIETGDIYWGFVTTRLVDYRADRLGAGRDPGGCGPGPLCVSPRCLSATAPQSGLRRQSARVGGSGGHLGGRGLPGRGLGVPGQAGPREEANGFRYRVLRAMIRGVAYAERIRSPRTEDCPLTALFRAEEPKRAAPQPDANSEPPRPPGEPPDWHRRRSCAAPPRDPDAG